MLSTLLTKMSLLKQGQWLVLVGVIIVLAASGVSLGLIPALNAESNTHLYYLGDLLIIVGVGLMVHRHSKEFPEIHVHSPTELCEASQLLAIKHATLLEHHPRAFYETTATGLVCSVNKAYSRLVKRAPMEIKGNNWYVTIHPSDRARVTKEWEDAIKKQRTFECEYLLQTSNGQSILVKNTASPMCLYADPFGYMGIIEPVSTADMLRE